MSHFQKEKYEVAILFHEYTEKHPLHRQVFLFINMILQTLYPWETVKSMSILW